LLFNNAVQTSVEHVLEKNPVQLAYNPYTKHTESANENHENTSVEYQEQAQRLLAAKGSQRFVMFYG